MASQSQDREVYQFGPFRLEPAELLCHGKPIRLEKRHIAVLRALVRNSPRVVEHDQLLDEAWGRTTHVMRTSVSGSIFALRRTLANGDDSQDYIETVPGIGYRFKLSPLRINDAPTAVPAVTIDSTLLDSLNSSRRSCIEQDVPFRTTNLMLTLLNMTSGFTEKALNSAKSGLGTSLRRRLRQFTTRTQPYIDRKKGLQHKDIEWFDLECMQKAADEARNDRCPVIMEKHLLLGILQSTTSRMVQSLRAHMSPKEFDTLIALVRADAGTPISEDFVL